MLTIFEETKKRERKKRGRENHWVKEDIWTGTRKAEESVDIKWRRESESKLLQIVKTTKTKRKCKKKKKKNSKQNGKESKTKKIRKRG